MFSRVEWMVVCRNTQFFMLNTYETVSEYVMFWLPMVDMRVCAIFFPTRFAQPNQKFTVAGESVRE